MPGNMNGRQRLAGAMMGGPQQLGAMGRMGDTQVGHLTPGEVVVPQNVLNQGDTRQQLGQGFEQAGAPMGRYEVGRVDDSINPLNRHARVLGRWAMAPEGGMGGGGAGGSVGGDGPSYSGPGPGEMGASPTCLSVVSPAETTAGWTPRRPLRAARALRVSRAAPVRAVATTARAVPSRAVTAGAAPTMGVAAKASEACFGKFGTKGIASLIGSMYGHSGAGAALWS